MWSIVSPKTLSYLGSGPRHDHALLERFARERRPEDREALIRRFTPLARSLALRYGNTGERDDILQVAYVGLLNAVERYDPDRGIAFSTFAVPTILGEIKRYFRDLGWSVRTPRHIQELAQRADRVTDHLTGELGRTPTLAEVAARCEATPEDVMEARGAGTAHRALSLDQPAIEDGESLGDHIGTQEPGFRAVEDGLEVDLLLDGLPERERLIMELRFRDELVQREIAERVGLSQMQVSRLLAKAISTLQAAHAP